MAISGALARRAHHSTLNGMDAGPTRYTRVVRTGGYTCAICGCVYEHTVAAIRISFSHSIYRVRMGKRLNGLWCLGFAGIKLNNIAMKDDLMLVFKPIF